MGSAPGGRRRGASLPAVRGCRVGAAQILLERALSAGLRSGDAALLGLLSGLAGRLVLRDDDGVATVRVRPAGGGGLLLEASPGFVEDAVGTDADALHLLLHELIHARGLPPDHADEADPQRRLAADLAAEVSANADLADRWFDRAPGYLERVYAASGLEAALLLPPDALLRSRGGGCGLPRAVSGLRRVLEQGPAGRARVEHAVGGALKEAGATHPARLASVYVRGWLDRLPAPALREELQAALACQGSCGACVRVPPLLGFHPPPGEPAGCGCGGREAEDLDRLLKGPGAGGGDRTLEERLAAVRERSSREFLEAVRLALTDDGSEAVPAVRPTAQPGVVPSPGRREVAWLAAGLTPALYPVALPEPDEDPEQVHLYLDVSASMVDTHALLFGLALHLGPRLGRQAWLFSTRVYPATPRELEEGRLRTTGGTDFDCVLRHALAYGFSRILVVTDGWADLSAAARARAKRAGLRGVTVFSEGPVGPLVDWSEAWFELPAGLRSVGPQPAVADDIPF